MAMSTVRRIGVNGLIDLDDFNECFFLFFGVSIVDVCSRNFRGKFEQLIYIYSVRKLSGLTIAKTSNLLGYSNYFIVGHSLDFCYKKLCIYSAHYDANFVAQYRAFKAYCKPFRKRLSNTDYVRKYRAKKRLKSVQINKRKK